MTNNDLIKFLKEHKNDLTLGGGFSHDELWNSFARKNSDYGFKENSVSFNFSWRDYTNYFIHVGSRAIVRPVSVALASLLIVLSGWAATVNASFASVPGDLLYPVKLATEKVQLSLAASSEQRARLHAEFAGRRLDEVMDISASSRSDKEVLVQTAVENFKQEVSSVGDELKNVSSAEGAAAVTELAEAVDRKVDEYSAALGQPTTVLNEQQNEAAAAVEKVQQEVTETVVSEHENSPQKETEKYLQTSFKNDFSDIQNRTVVVLARFVRIEKSLLTNTEEGTEENFAKISELRKELGGFDKRLTESMDLFAAGGYRSVWNEVSDMKNVLNNAEELAKVLEIEISTTLIN